MGEKWFDKYASGELTSDNVVDLYVNAASCSLGSLDRDDFLDELRNGPLAILLLESPGLLCLLKEKDLASMRGYDRGYRYCVRIMRRWGIDFYACEDCASEDFFTEIQEGDSICERCHRARDEHERDRAIGRINDLKSEIQYHEDKIMSEDMSDFDLKWIENEIAELEAQIEKEEEGL